jgi:DNA-binding NtrC family response regulator
LKRMQPRMVKIIITGEPSVENAVKALYEKADGFVSKPFDSQELLETIRKLVAEKKDEYLQLLTEAENAKKNNPILGYKTPDRW